MNISNKFSIVKRTALLSLSVLLLWGCFDLGTRYRLIVLIYNFYINRVNRNTVE